MRISLKIRLQFGVVGTRSQVDRFVGFFRFFKDRPSLEVYVPSVIWEEEGQFQRFAFITFECKEL